MNVNTKARLLLRERLVLSETAFVEIVAWQARGSSHGCKYRLALVTVGTCVLRYDKRCGIREATRRAGHDVKAYIMATCMPC